MEVQFTINGKSYKLTPGTVPVDVSLNTFIREHAQLRGTKFMCLEGGCGACIVTARGIHPVTKEKKTWSINSCLCPVYSCQGLEITTIEGVGNKKDGYHPIQTRLAHLNGTQCGYCSPGMVMNLYSLMEAKNTGLSMIEIENSFGGNICRCTGYRPILDAFKGMAFDADPKLTEACHDIEDLYKMCPKTGDKCMGKCEKPGITKPIDMLFDDSREWHKVFDVADLFAILQKIGSKPYMLVAGNTAHGVYRRDKNIQIFIDITDIEELRSHTIDQNVVVGGNVNLTETMEIFEKAATKKPEFEYLRHLIKHIDLIANVPVRNSGTIAGNLIIKNQHNEFPSDVYLLLESVGAKLTISGSSTKSSDVSPLEFIKMEMKGKIITKITLPPIQPNQFIYRSYKIMPRAQNAHAYVNAGFLIEFNDKKNKIVSARICFGGINPEFTHATATEKILIDKDFYTNETLRMALKTLNEEINPDWVLPDASSDFRKNLAISLFYKFVLATCPDTKMKPEMKSGGAKLERPLSSGTQTFDTYKEKWPLTQPVPKVEAIAQCSGEAIYANDVPHQPGELWAAFVPATQVHSKIDSIDPSEALKYPGVVAFFSAKDIPGKNSFSPNSLIFLEADEEIFCSGEVLFNGQPAGIIVAETFDIANHAVNLVKIIYEKTATKPVLPTMKDVFENNAIDRFIDTPQDNKESMLSSSHNMWTFLYNQILNKPQQTHTITGHFEIGGQYHFTMETQSCVCIPIEDGMQVFATTQWMDLTQIAIADMLKLPDNQINVEVRRLGGGYGAKISRNAQISCAAALACNKLNRPIRFVMTIESNMNVVGKRLACQCDYEVEVDDRGKIQKLKNDFFQDYGCSPNEGIAQLTQSNVKNCYDNSNWTVTGKGINTDSPSTTWCRSPGHTEAIAMTENIMEHIARITKQKPEDVRLANIADSNPIKKMMLDFIKSCDFVKRRTEIDDFNSKNRWRKRGIAIVPMEYQMGYFGNYQAIVAIHHGDGSVSVSHGGIEMGQGINTKVAQVAAHALGITMDRISVKPSNSFTAANSNVSGGSIASECVAFAVNKACEILLERMKPVRNGMKSGSKWEEIVEECYNKDVNLITNYMYKAADIKNYFVNGCSCAEVEVDLLTGNLQLLRVDILEDTGESMSPLVDVGQVEGAFIMGIGYWLTENLIYNNQNGELLTNRTWHYKPPGAKDIPIDFRVTFLQKASNPLGVLRSKMTGEPPLCMSIVVIFALRHALDSARKDAKITEEWYHMGAPTTPEHIHQLSGLKTDQFQL